MNLTLDVISLGGAPGKQNRVVITQDGGTIGRAPGNRLVLSSGEVSSSHAVVSFSSGVFYIQDSSRNGTALNTPQNKLVPQRPYALKSGDRIFIEPFELQVSVDDGFSGAAWGGGSDVLGQDDPFAPVAPLAGGSSGSPLTFDEGEVDPLKFFQPLPSHAAPRAHEPAHRPTGDALIDVAFQAPVPMPPPPSPAERSAGGGGGIPVGYDPLADDGFGVGPDMSDPFAPAPAPPSPVYAPPRQAARPVPPPVVAPPPAAVPRPAPSSGRRVVSSRRTGAVPIIPPDQAPPATADPVVPVRPAESVRAADAPVPEPPRTPPASPSAVSGPDPLALILEGAGLKDAPVTPELARNFGQILRIVVSGVMDVLHARQGIKEEFRMRQTMFRPADNNPLKFSANVDDALHNLLVKKNPAYLGAVDAFGDAFDDLRDHQIAMLAGMRVAFEHLLSAFDPERLQREFEDSAAKGAFPLMPTKMRYWDLFIDKRRDMVRDPESAFAELFGAEFARAYEEQFRQLKAQRGRKTE